MAKYILTNKQKSILRSLASGLRNETMGTLWSISRGGSEFVQIYEPDNKGGWHPIFDDQQVKESDIRAFTDHGFLNPTSKGGHTLNEALILDAVDHDFVADEEVQKTQININGGDFRGSNINIASTLNHVQQSINSASSLKDDTKAQLTQLLKDLTEALRNVPEENTDDTDVLVRHTQSVADELNAATPNKKWLQTNVNGLEKAAKNLERILPPVFAIAVKIVMILRPLTM